MIPNLPVKYIPISSIRTKTGSSLTEKCILRMVGKDWALLYQLLKRFANTKGTTFYPKDTAIQKYSNNNFRKTFVNKLYIIFIINKNDRENILIRCVIMS